MMQGYIAGIFVDKNHRSCGIGKQLLTYVKQKYDTLSLKVYQKNTKAAAFIIERDFSSAQKEWTKTPEKKNIRCFGRDDIGEGDIR